MDTGKPEAPERDRHDGHTPDGRRPAWTLGGMLVIAYLWEGVIGKSCLARIPRAWVVHMALSGLLAALIIWHAFLEGEELELPEGVERRRASVYAICVLIAVWGALSALAQDTYLAELGFVGMWFFMVAACWSAAPRLLAGVPTRELVRLVALPLKLGVLASVVWLLFDTNYDLFVGRFPGVFYTSSAGGETFVLCSVVSLAQILSSTPKPRPVDIGCFALSLLFVLLTRSRGAITVAGMSVVAVWLFRPGGTSRLEKVLALATLVISLAIAIEVGGHDQSRHQAAAFLRIDGGIRHAVLCRYGVYEDGLRGMMRRPFFGLGFTSRYSSGGGIQFRERARGEIRSVYSFDDDPHLMVITLGKAIGFPGLFLGLALILAVALIGWYAASRATASDAAGASLLVGVVVVALGQSMFTNTLTSFGAIADRYAWFLIGVLSARFVATEEVDVPPRAAGELTGPRARTRP